MKRSSSTNLISTRPSISSGSSSGQGMRRPSPQKQSASQGRQSSGKLQLASPSLQSKPSQLSLMSPSSASSSWTLDANQTPGANSLPSPPMVIETSETEVQTSFSIPPSEDTVFLTLEELRHIKQEKDSLEALLQESMETMEIIKQKYVQTKAANMDMEQVVESLTQRCGSVEEERDRLRNELAELRLQLVVSKQAEALAVSRLQEQSSVPHDVLEASRVIIRTDAEMRQLQRGCLEGVKELTDRACDFLVETETDHQLLADRFPGVSFVKKEEFDPYKGVPKKTVVPSGPAFIFGSPSQRYPIIPPISDDCSDQSVVSADPSLASNHSSDTASDDSENGHERLIEAETSYDNDLQDDRVVYA